MSSYLYYKITTLFAVLNATSTEQTMMILMTETVDLYEFKTLTKCAVLGALLFVMYSITSIETWGRKFPSDMHSLSVNRELSDAQLRQIKFENRVYFRQRASNFSRWWTFSVNHYSQNLLATMYHLNIKLFDISLTDWARVFDGIFSLKRFTNTTLIIFDRKLMKNLLDKKSNIFSNRFASIVAQLITQDDHLLIMNYEKRWQMIRKLVHQHFMKSMCEKQHVHVQHVEATQMMRDFLLNSQNHMSHPKRYSNSIINSLGSSFGHFLLSYSYLKRSFSNKRFNASSE